MLLRGLGLGVSLALTMTNGCSPVEQHEQTPVRLSSNKASLTDLSEALSFALSLYERAVLHAFTVATDEYERGNSRVTTPFLQRLSETDDYEAIFIIGDESFEAELDGVLGAGIGPQPGAPLPARPQRLQRGELGGLDAGSCRGCHFNGGPDGGGAFTQVALFRSDGQDLESATLRDAPHVMGLGYIERVAQTLERELQWQVSLATSQAEFEGAPVTWRFELQGVDFGEVTFSPDGGWDMGDNLALSADLQLRPFGLKGRHHSLVDLSDEALQLHLGLQSQGRVEAYADQATTYLGRGESVYDYDQDGVQSELTEAQAVLQAAYLSMLGTPVIRPPEDPTLALIWARGHRLMDEVGCLECHREALYFHDYVTELQATGDSGFFVQLDLEEAGLEPKPRNIDATPDPEDPPMRSAPVFAFTDLRRHEMGPELAEPVAEQLPDGEGEVSGSVWLTRPLWGLADTAPYLHDGRAPTVHDAILAHGGEAQQSRDAYVDLDPEQQGALRLFLMSLTREPVLLVE